MKLVVLVFALICVKCYLAFCSATCWSWLVTLLWFGGRPTANTSSATRLSLQFVVSLIVPSWHYACSTAFYEVTQCSHGTPCKCLCGSALLMPLPCVAVYTEQARLRKPPEELAPMIVTMVPCLSCVACRKVASAIMSLAPCLLFRSANVALPRGACGSAC